MRLEADTFDMIGLGVVWLIAVIPVVLDAVRRRVRGGARWTATSRGGARVRFVADPPRCSAAARIAPNLVMDVPRY
jgi:hypothetical protein